MIYGFFGDPRQGKSVSAVAEIRKLWEKGATIYSNIWLSFPHYNLTADMMIDISEGRLKPEGDNPCFFVDEIIIWGLFSRRGMTDIARAMIFFALQTGKYGDKKIGMYLIYTTQYPRLIDVVVWEVTNMKAYCLAIEIQGLTLIYQMRQEKVINRVETYSHVICANTYFDMYNTQQFIYIPQTKLDKLPRYR